MCWCPCIGFYLLHSRVAPLKIFDYESKKSDAIWVMVGGLVAIVVFGGFPALLWVIATAIYAISTMRKYSVAEGCCSLPLKVLCCPCCFASQMASQEGVYVGNTVEVEDVVVDNAVEVEGVVVGAGAV